MNKKEFLDKVLSSKREAIVEGSEHYDFPETEEVVSVWWVKHVFNDVFKNKSETDDKYYKTSTCDRDNSVDMGDVDEH